MDDDDEDDAQMSGANAGPSPSYVPEIGERNKQCTPISIINTNARSLCPKTLSSVLIDCFEELDVDIGIITETWLADGESLNRDLYDLAKGAGLDMICLNRPPNNRGNAHGGVAIIANNSSCTIKKLPNPEGYEVLVTLSSLPGYSRKLLTVGCYLPPNYPVPRDKFALEHIENVVRELKRTYKEPFIVVGSDFNQWDVGETLLDFPDLREVQVGPTRNGRCIDRIFSNFGHSISDCGTVPPLEPEPGHQGSRSDHRVAFMRVQLPKSRAFNRLSFQHCLAAFGCLPRSFRTEQCRYGSTPPGRILSLCSAGCHRDQSWESYCSTSPQTKRLMIGE